MYNLHMYLTKYVATLKSSQPSQILYIDAKYIHLSKLPILCFLITFTCNKFLYHFP